MNTICLRHSVTFLLIRIRLVLIYTTVHGSFSA